MTNMTLPDLKYLTSILSLQRPKFSIFPYLLLYAQHDRMLLNQSVFHIKIVLLNALRKCQCIFICYLGSVFHFSSVGVDT
jgi:hypothetical protein